MRLSQNWDLDVWPTETNLTESLSPPSSGTFSDLVILIQSDFIWNGKYFNTETLNMRIIF